MKTIEYSIDDNQFMVNELLVHKAIYDLTYEVDLKFDYKNKTASTLEGAVVLSAGDGSGYINIRCGDLRYRVGRGEYPQYIMNIVFLLYEKNMIKNHCISARNLDTPIDPIRISVKMGETEKEISRGVHDDYFKFCGKPVHVWDVIEFFGLGQNHEFLEFKSYVLEQLLDRGWSEPKFIGGIFRHPLYHGLAAISGPRKHDVTIINHGAENTLITNKQEFDKWLNTLD